MRMHTLTLLIDEGAFRASQPVFRTRNQEPMGVSFVWWEIEKREGSKNRRRMFRMIDGILRRSGSRRDSLGGVLLAAQASTIVGATAG
jgi:hypothetical protein